MLVRMNDVAVVAEDKIRNGRNQSFTVGARDQEDGRVLHSVRAAGGKNTWVGVGKPVFSSQCPALSYFFSDFKISFAALTPDPPVNPTPGCVPDPHKYKFSIGVL